MIERKKIHFPKEIETKPKEEYGIGRFGNGNYETSQKIAAIYVFERKAKKLFLEITTRYGFV